MTPRLTLRRPTMGIETPGGYRVTGLLGRGGMGVLLAARRLTDGHPVVLKAAASHHAQAQYRFSQEARALASLDHPGVVRLLDVDCLPSGVPVLVLEQAPGATLRRILEYRPLPWAVFSRLASQLAEAIDHCHRRGVVHRDLKPENIVVGPDSVKIIDFGLARLLRDPSPGDRCTPALGLFGTPPYIAPEQLACPREAGPACDLYSLGIVLRECYERSHSSWAGADPEQVERWLDRVDRLCHPQAEVRSLPVPEPPPLPPPVTGLSVASQTPTRVTERVGSARIQPAPILLLLGLSLSIGCLIAAWLGLQPRPTVLVGRCLPGQVQSLTIQADPERILRIEPRGDTQLRGRGVPAWSTVPLTLHADRNGVVVIQILDRDGTWEMAIDD